MAAGGTQFPPSSQPYNAGNGLNGTAHDTSTGYDDGMHNHHQHAYSQPTMTKAKKRSGRVGSSQYMDWLFKASLPHMLIVTACACLGSVVRQVLRFGSKKMHPQVYDDAEAAPSVNLSNACC